MIKGPKLIFIDGIVGCGKSRLAQRLWPHLRKSGLDAEWFAEPNRATRCTIWVISPSSTQWPRARWRLKPGAAFVDERRASERITVLDRHCCKHQCGSLNFSQSRRKTGSPRLAGLLRVAEPLAPALIYLHPNDLDRFIDWVAEIRGAEWRSDMEALFARFGGAAGMRAYTPSA